MPPQFVALLTEATQYGTRAFELVALGAWRATRIHWDGTIIKSLHPSLASWYQGFLCRALAQRLIHTGYVHMRLSHLVAREKEH